MLKIIMAKIRSLRDASESERRRKKWGGILIISLLLLSTLGFAIGLVGFGSQGTNEEDVQGFSHNGQYWVYTAGSQKYYFLHHIDETNKEIVFDKTLVDFANKRIFIDSEIAGGFDEINNNLARYSPKVSEACYEECQRDLPEKTCDGEDKLIVIREDENQNIEEVGSCVFINGDMKVVDAFLYKILGIN